MNYQAKVASNATIFESDKYMLNKYFSIHTCYFFFAIILKNNKYAFERK